MPWRTVFWASGASTAARARTERRFRHCSPHLQGSRRDSCLVFPAFALTYVLLLIGLWNVAAGLLQLIGSIVLRHEIQHGWLMALGGLLGAGLGLLIMLYPANAAVSIIWLIAGTAILLGLLLVLFAWKLRGAGKRIA